MLDVKSSTAATLQHGLVKHPLLATVPCSSAAGCIEDVKRKSFKLEYPGFKWNGFQQQAKRREHQRRLGMGYAWRSAKSWTWLRGENEIECSSLGSRITWMSKLVQPCCASSLLALPSSAPNAALLSSHHSRALQLPCPVACEHLETMNISTSKTFPPENRKILRLRDRGFHSPDREQKWVTVF